MPAPPPPQAGRDGSGRKHGFGIELRVIAGLLYRNPAMTYMHALSTEIALGCVQNHKRLWWIMLLIYALSLKVLQNHIGVPAE